MNAPSPNSSVSIPPDPAQQQAVYPGSRVAFHSPGTGSTRPVTFWTILDAFRRRWVPCLAVAIPAALLVAGIFWQMIPAQFESTAVIKINQYESTVLNQTQDKASLSDFLHFRDTQINHLMSRPVIAAACRRENVAETRMISERKQPVEWLLEELIVEVGYSAEFVNVTLAGEHPTDLATIVNAIKDVYMDRIVYGRRSERVKEMEAMRSRLAEVEKNLRQNQDRIADMAQSLGTSDSKSAVINQQIVLEDIRSMKAELRKINADIRREETLRSYLRDEGYAEAEINDALPVIGLGGNGTSETPDTTAGSKRTSMRRQLAIVQQKIAQFEAYSRVKDHPDLLMLKAQEKAMKKYLAGTLGPANTGVAVSNYSHLLKQRDKMENEIKQTEQRLDQMAVRQLELERETADLKYLEKSRDELKAEINNRDIELDTASARISVVQDANVPEKRNIKLRAQVSVAGGFGVFGLIVAGFTMFEWFSYRLSSTSDIANAVNLRLIGTIPSPDSGGLLGLGIFAGQVDYDEWNRAVVESMDVVRTYLMRHIDPGRSASLLITSASANEGKTTVSCQLAASLARAGKRVAIVDCDFRRPSAHLLLAGKEGPGLCEYIRGEVTLESIYQETQAPGLTFIPAGQVDQIVLQSLSADGGRLLISTLKEQFDFVIIDTSPMLFVAEPSMLAQNADIVLLSTRKDYSRIPYVAQSRDSLRSLQVPLLGAVMVGSDSDFQRQSYGYRQEVTQHTHRSSDRVEHTSAV